MMAEGESMPRLVLSLDGVVLREVGLEEARGGLGGLVGSLWRLTDWAVFASNSQYLTKRNAS